MQENWTTYKLTKGQAAVKVNKAKGKNVNAIRIPLKNLSIRSTLSVDIKLIMRVDVTQLVTYGYWLLFQPLLSLKEMICGIW